MKSKDLISIRTYANEMLAELARMALERCGIDAVIMKDDVGGLNPYLRLAIGVNLVVRQEQKEEALSVLKDLERSDGNVTPENLTDE